MYDSNFLMHFLVYSIMLFIIVILTDVCISLWCLLSLSLSEFYFSVCEYLPSYTVCLCTTPACLCLQKPEEALDLLKLQLQVTVSFNMCFENQTQVLWKSRECFYLLSHLSSWSLIFTMILFTETNTLLFNELSVPNFQLWMAWVLLIFVFSRWNHDVHL